jgi:hypothetical protein
MPDSLPGFVPDVDEPEDQQVTPGKEDQANSRENYPNYLSHGGRKRTLMDLIGKTRVRKEEVLALGKSGWQFSFLNSHFLGKSNLQQLGCTDELC